MKTIKILRCDWSIALNTCRSTKITRKLRNVDFHPFQRGKLRTRGSFQVLANIAQNCWIIKCYYGEA